VTFLDSRPYRCYYVPGNVAAGSSAEPFEYPLLSGSFATVVTLILLACAQDTLRRCVGNACQDLAGLLRPLLGLCCLSVVANVLLLPPARPGKAGRTRAFEGGFWPGAGLREAPSWQADVEENPWQDMFTIMFSLLGVGFAISFASLLLQCILCSSRSGTGEEYLPAE